MKDFIYLIIGVILGMAISNWLFPPRIPSGWELVSEEWLDSLRTVAEAPPDTVIQVDTIMYEKETIRYVEVPVHVEVDEETNFVQDTLRTPHFALYLEDTLRNNFIVSRGFNYDLFVPETITRTITLTQPVPFPYPVQERGRLYGGINAGQVISADLSYRFGDNFLGVGMGYLDERFWYIRYQRKLW